MKVTTEFPKSKDAILSLSWIEQKTLSNLNSHILSEINYIGPINLNYDLLKQALCLENSTQNKRNLQTTTCKNYIGNLDNSGVCLKEYWKAKQQRSIHSIITGDFLQIPKS